MAARVAVLTVISAGLALSGCNRNGNEAVTDGESTTTVAARAITTPTPVSTTTPTPSPSVLSPSAGSQVTTPVPKPVPVVTKKPVVEEGTPMIIGALFLTIPGAFERTDGSDLQSVSMAEFIGPDNGTFNGREYPSTLRLSSEGFEDMPDDLLTLMEDICPFGDGSPKFEHREATATIGGMQTLVIRDTYTCEESTFTSAVWQAEDARGNRFSAEYFFLGDRRPAELTAAFESGKLLG